MMKVSVILPTYNSGPGLQDTLDSIFNQQGAGSEYEIELIVIDDCSTDQTQDLLRRQGIDFLTTNYNTGGPNAGRNIGLEKASGDAICLIDHDDIWSPEKLRNQLRLLQFCPIVTSAYTVVDRKLGHIFDSVRSGQTQISPANEVFLRKLSKSKRGPQIYPGTLMFTRSLKGIRFEEKYGMADFDWQLRLFEKRYVAEISKSLLTRFINGNNLSLEKTYRKNDYEIALECFRMYEEAYPEHVAIARKRMNGSMARYFYLTGEMRAARTYFKKSAWNLKTLLYYGTSYYGNTLVKRHFRVFG